MADLLVGARVAFLTANEGVEQSELTETWACIEAEGGVAELLAPQPGTVQAFVHLDRGDTFAVDRTVADAGVDDYDALVLPGGVANPDALRTDVGAVAFVQAFVESGKLVAAICHAPWLLVEADDVVRGRRLTSWPSLRTDIRNAGGTWVDERVVLDGNVLTSREPSDLPTFCDALVRTIRTQHS